MRITSRLRSLRLCAFSVFNARIRKASPSSGDTSAVICLSPSTLAAARRWRPFGVQNSPSSPRTTMIGSRNDPASSIFCARRWCGLARGLAGRASAAPTRAAGPPPARCCRIAVRDTRRSALRRARAPARRAPQFFRRRSAVQCPKRPGRAWPCSERCSCGQPRSSYGRPSGTRAARQRPTVSTGTISIAMNAYVRYP